MAKSQWRTNSTHQTPLEPMLTQKPHYEELILDNKVDTCQRV